MRAVVVALLTALASGAMSIAGGEWATRAHHVSEMEGGRAMAVIFLIGPAGLVLGGIIGLVTALRVKGDGARAFFKALGVSLGVAALTATAVFGYAILRAPTPPLLDGQGLSLDIEVRMPPGRTVPTDPDDFTVLLTSRGYGDDRHNADLRLDATTLSDERVVIPGSAFLYTSTSQRFLVVNDVGEAYYWFDLPLRAKPRAEDTAWTDWWPKPGESATVDIHGNGGFQIRYRVQKTASE